MTEYLYFNPKLIKLFISAGVSSLDSTQYYIGSIGDLCLETEYHKESATLDEMKTQFLAISKEQPNFFFQEVSKNELLANLFDELNGALEINSEINASTSPHFSINYVALSPKFDYCFWDLDIVSQMKLWFRD